MYIEFQLPQGMSTRVMSGAIQAEVALWAHKHQIPDSAYSQKTIKHTHRLGFNNEKYFSLFSMTWQSDREDVSSWFQYRIVNIVNERY
jgi:hypothetical protein